MGFHDIQMKSISGDAIDFSQFKGQYALCVNVASHWGATPQYAGLRTLHNDVDGLVVLGFPCNQFGNQEPGTDKEIAEFASSTYDVNFPMFAKGDVNGEKAAAVYQQMKTEQPGDGDDSDIKWNFEKFLVNPQGQAVARWDTGTTPEDIAAQLPDLMA